MKTTTLSLITSLLLFANVSLHAEENVESKFTQSTDAPIHNFYDYSSPVHPISKEAKAYYEAMGLTKNKNCASAVKHQYDKLAQTPQEFFEGLSLTMEAMTALDHNQTSDAQTKLTKASDAFDKAFKAHPELKMVPVDVDIEIEDHEVTNENVKAITQNAIRMLKEHDVQEAIALLSELKNQINVTTLYLPMAFYETGTKVAAEALKKGKQEEAMRALVAGFNSMMVQESMIPIALLDSQAAIIAASVVDKEDKEAAHELLESAKANLEQARLLGYTTKYSDDYKALSDQIHAIQKEIKGKNEVEKLYDSVKKDYNMLLDKIVGAIPLIGS